MGSGTQKLVNTMPHCKYKCRLGPTSSEMDWRKVEKCAIV